MSKTVKMWLHLDHQFAGLNPMDVLCSALRVLWVPSGTWPLLPRQSMFVHQSLDSMASVIAATPTLTPVGIGPTLGRHWATCAVECASCCLWITVSPSQQIKTSARADYIEDSWQPCAQSDAAADISMLHVSERQQLTLLIHSGDPRVEMQTCLQSRSVHLKSSRHVLKTHRTSPHC